MLSVCGANAFNPGLEFEILYDEQLLLTEHMRAYTGKRHRHETGVRPSLQFEVDACVHALNLYGGGGRDPVHSSVMDRRPKLDRARSRLKKGQCFRRPWSSKWPTAPVGRHKCLHAHGAIVDISHLSTRICIGSGI